MGKTTRGTATRAALRHSWAAVLLALLLWALPLPGSAVSVEQALTRQEELADIDSLEQAAEDSGGTAEYGASLNDGLQDLVETGTEELTGAVRRALRSGVLLLAILLFCGLAETLGGAAGEKNDLAVVLAGTLAVAAVAVTDLYSLLGLGVEAIGNMADFSNVLLPTVAVVTAATGAVTGASVRQMAAALFSDLLVNLINSLLVPLLYGYIGASIAHAALGNPGLKQLASLLKWAVTTVLTVVMLVFVGYLTLSGVVAGTADAATVKAAKFAISGAIPVVGGILSDASETILASAGVLKGTVGVFGAVTILGICLVPVLRLSVHYLVYKLVAAVAATMGNGRLCGLVEQLGGAFGLLLGMTGACGLLLLIALVSSISAVSV